MLQYKTSTPPTFRHPTQPCSACRAGETRLASLVPAADLALGDSEYNRLELEALGFRQTGVIPIAVDTDRLTQAPPHPVLDDILDDGLVNFLFVGRIAPNKRIEDHIRLAEQYKRYVDAYYRFIFVGRYDVVPRYYATIRALLAQYEMLEDRFIFTGPVPDVELAAYYRASSVYISLSEHEGFCVPLLESMAMDVPVLAYSAAAVPDTLGDAGVQFAPKDLEYAAELLGMLAFEERPRERFGAQRAAAGLPIRDRTESDRHARRVLSRIAFSCSGRAGILGGRVPTPSINEGMAPPTSRGAQTCARDT